MSAFEEVLKWVGALPTWQQDAVRRLMEADQLGSADIAELAILAKAEAGVPLPEGTRAAQTLVSPVDSQKANQGGSVHLTRIDSVQNINALAAEQPINFAPVGITVLFGDNGSGKTGFGRLLRTICWARKRPLSILKNITKKSSLPQQAVVSYRVGEAEFPQVNWTEGLGPPPELSRISVFDADCASVYLNDEQQSTYAPFGLDLFPKLARACDDVRALVQVELDELRKGAASWPEDLQDTAVGAELANLPNPSALEALQGVLPLTPKDRENFEALTAAREAVKRENSSAKVSSLRSQALRLRSIASRATKLANLLAPAQAEELKSLVADAALKKAAAKAASDLAFGTALLPGTGGPVWEELWKAAKKFSQDHAYHGHPFPAVALGQKCVLCQQELDSEANRRLMSFEVFVNDEAATQATTASQTLSASQEMLRTADCEWGDIESVAADLDSAEVGLGASLQTFLNDSKSRKEFLLGADAPTDWAALPKAGENPAGRLELLATGCSERAQTIEDAGKDEQRQKQESEWKDFNAREWVIAHQLEISAEAERRKRDAQLVQVTKRGTDTQKITTTGNALTEKYVTAALQKRFEAELLALRGNHLGVKLEVKRGAKGKTTHHLILTRGADLKVVDILSTGERNTVALAAFFAELDPERTDTIIFDDPVSSLDQDKRDQVAQRLCKEAAKRQVIVWTHDLSFLGALQDWRENLKAPEIKILTIHNLNGEPGIIEEALPWPVMKLSERITRLRAELVQLREAADEKDPELYGMRSRHFYGRMRDAWERAVEEVLFRKVIERHRKSIQTKLLREVADNVTKDDFETIHEQMSYCSNLAHDAPRTTPPTPPHVSQSEQDLLKLEGWIKSKRTK